jgi:hypothetical protein
MTGARGVILQVARLTWRHATAADVVGGYYLTHQQAASFRYDLEPHDGRWAVTAAHLLWWVWPQHPRARDTPSFVCTSLYEADGTLPVYRGERAAWVIPEAAVSLSMAFGAATLVSPNIVASAKATRALRW